MTSDVRVEVLSDTEHLRECADLYRRVFAATGSSESINTRLLVAIAANGGIIVGAIAHARLIGFAYSFLGRDFPGHQDGSGHLYQYSQTAVVDSHWRGRGIGRALKLEQRRAALAQGIDTMYWLFDPFTVANAYFNLDVLGGLGVQLKLRAYGNNGTAADGDEPTDRFQVEWQLDSQRVRDRTNGKPSPELPAAARSLAVGEVLDARDEVLLGVPADWRITREQAGSGSGSGSGGKDGSSGRAGSRDLREQITGQIQNLLTDGYCAFSCPRVTDTLATYRFMPRERGSS